MSTDQPELAKAYDASTEPDLYARWEAANTFEPKARTEGERTYSILMPPPNANGALHVGHAVFVTLQDLMVRYHRMRGDATVWYPGLDHAGFETQVVFEKHLEKQGSSRFSMERGEFYNAALAFTKQNAETITNQLRRLGASADWTRTKFTLDDDVVQHVYQTFVQLYEDGLAYRDLRPVHWCTKHQTTLSDLETKDEQRNDPLYYLKYGPLVAATVRPETIFVDVALAVHPDDERYKQYVGTTITRQTPIGEDVLPVIADEMVDPAFGTGVVKITSAHDANDFEVAKRHDLPYREVIDQYGKLNEHAGKYAGMKVDEARKAVAEDLAKLGLLERVDEGYQHAIKVCYKCSRTIEPRIMKQWFIAMNTPGSKTGKNLTQLALDAVDNGATKFVTPKFEKIFRHWLGNIRDWPVSRQIVWGIQLPIWYRGDEVYVGVEAPEGEGWEQDPDTFDTWFSSGQWPVVVPKTAGGDDFERFYPTAVMETGWDILFFWVARMMMFGLYLTDEVPFRTVYLHGLVRDKDRQKMSKSKGNVMDPLAVIDQYGADALRMALVFGTAAGNDLPMGEEKIRGMRNFTNKLWNIGRYVLMTSADASGEPEPQTDADRKVLAQLHDTVVAVTKDIESYRFHEAAQVLYHFVWDEFASVYVEASKAQLQDESTKGSTQAILRYGLVTILKLAHPFVPFVTEALWQQLPAKARDSELLITAPWPRGKE